MHHLIKPGESFEMLGNGPTFSQYQRMARGLAKKGEPFEIVKHRFHFIVDQGEALVMWVCSGRLYQKRMSLDGAESLFGTLERSGFRVNRLN